LMLTNVVIAVGCLLGLVAIKAARMIIVAVDAGQWALMRSPREQVAQASDARLSWIDYLLPVGRALEDDFRDD